MTDVLDLKRRLAAIARDDYRAADEADVWPLALQMMAQLGSPDPELRDELIYRTLAHWAELYFDAAQLRALLAIAVDDEHLTLRLGERDTDTVFTRAFSSLAVAIFVNQHRERSYLSAEDVLRVHERMVFALDAEHDLRGWVEGKGWADAVAHAADALDELALCPELGEAQLRETLRVVRDTVVRALVVFANAEEERLVTVVLSVARRGLLTTAELSSWVLSFIEVEPLPTYREWHWRRTTITHFLRAMYFRSRYEGIAVFEPALEQALAAIAAARF